MRKIILIFTIFILVTSLFANLDKVISQTKISKLNQLSLEFKTKWDAKHNYALERAKQLDIPIFIDTGNGVNELSHFDEFDNPIYHILHNVDAAATISTDHVYPSGVAGLSLNGNGITIGEWDGDAVRDTHQEFDTRTTNGDSSTLGNNSFHATHVAGTIMASGDYQSDAKGMAFDANLLFHDWDNDTSEMATAATQGLLLSNHSYGFGFGWNWTGFSWEWRPGTGTEDPYFGFYSSNEQDYDEIAYDAPYYLICFAAGNDDGDGGGTGPAPDDGPYDCLGSGGVAKNVLTVAAVEDIAAGYSVPADVVKASFSSTGPMDDGRIKPDISANGTDLYSTYDGSDSDYDSISGTSMATPSVTGSLALIQEHYNEVNPDDYLRSSTLKALTIHCADEAGSNDGPDYKFGWGLMNTARMANYISNEGIDVRIIEETLSNGGTYEIIIPANGTEAFKATLCWTDPEGTPVALSIDPPDPMLINDLDIRITKGASTYYPWKLDRLNPANAATNNGDNTVDNVEQVCITNPTWDFYTIEVTHKGTLYDDTGSPSSQEFGLLVSGIGDDPPIPDITVNPTSLSETLGLNQTEQQTLTISNDGESGSTLNYSLIIENNTRSLNSNLKYKAYGIKEKLARGLTITYEEKNILKEFENKRKIISPTIGRASATCYPTSSAYWSGSTTSSAKTYNSEARVYGGGESGWIMFDISSIPDDAAITSIVFNFYVNDANWPYWSTTPVSNDPITTSASILHADIIAEEETDYYNQLDEGNDYAAGWKNLTLGGEANTDLFNQLSSDWFAIGLSSRDGSDTYYLEIDGWNETNVPYIVVNYTPNIPVLEITSPNGGEVWANGESRDITWDHSGAALTNVKLNLSINNGMDWTEIVDSTPNDPGIYEWTVSGTASEECLVRVSDPNDSDVNDISNAAFRIYDTVSWLSIDQNNGALGQGFSDYLTLTFDSSGLSAGTYNANITISSNDPDEASVIIPVTLTVNDNSSSGSGDNGGGSGPVEVEMPLTNIDGETVDPDTSVDPEGDVGIIVNVTVTDEIQGSVSVPNPDNVIISYAIDVIGAITDVNLAIDLEYTGLAPLDQVYWFDGTNWLAPAGVIGWSTPNHVTFNLSLTDRNASTEIILSRDDPLPVALSSFTAIYSGGSPLISWATQSESDNIGWNVYRGISNNLGQTLILNSNTIPGSGSTTEPTYYSYTDEYPVQENHTYWYWLESICTDGETDFFGPVYLTIDVDGNYIPEIPLKTELYQNFPNPFNPNTLIAFDIEENKSGELSIYNIKGQILVKEEFEAGRHNYSWDASAQSSGVYFYKLQVDRIVKTMKMVLVK